MTLSALQQLILAMTISQYLDPIKAFSPESEGFSGGLEDSQALLAMKLMVAGSKATPEQERILTIWGVKHCVNEIRNILKNHEPVAEALKEEVNKRITRMEANGITPFDDIPGLRQRIAAKGFTLDDFTLFQHQRLTYPQISAMFGVSEKADAEIQSIPAGKAQFSLKWARTKGHFHVAKRLLETREDLFGENTGLKFLEAINNNDTAKVTTLVTREDISPNLAGLALRQAGCRNYAAIARIILDARKDIPFPHIRSTLNGAITYGCVEVAATLLEKRYAAIRDIDQELFSRASILILQQVNGIKPPVAIGSKMIESRATAQTNGHSVGYSL